MATTDDNSYDYKSLCFSALAPAHTPYHKPLQKGTVILFLMASAFKRWREREQSKKNESGSKETMTSGGEGNISFLQKKNISSLFSFFKKSFPVWSSLLFVFLR